MLLEKMEHVSDEEKKRLPKRIFFLVCQYSRLSPPDFFKAGDLIDVTLFLQFHRSTIMATF